MITNLRSLLFLAVASIAASCLAIEVDGIQKEHRPIVVTHEPGEIINVLFWQPEGPVLLDDSHFVRGDTQTVWTAPVGTYAVVRAGSSVVVITSDGTPRPTPPVPPNPPGPKPPDPPEPPEPDTETIVTRWIVIVEELNERHLSPAKTAVITAVNFWQQLGFKFRLYDKDQPVAEPYAKIAGDNLPAIILMADDGSYITGPLPDTLEATESFIRSHTLR